MAVAVRVPLNTMLADLDEALRVLLKRELGRHGFDGVEIAFDAPTKDWSARSRARRSTSSSTTCASRPTAGPSSGSRAASTA